MNKKCKFCAKLKKHHKCGSGTEHDDVLFENRHIVVMEGRPHHKGHLLVMPRVHEENLLRLKKETLRSFFNDTILVMRALGKAIHPDRFNLEYLDNWDAHIHWNIYPRFKTDPDFGNPPVIPEKNQAFKSKKLSKQEYAVFVKELKKIRKKLW